MGVRVVDGNIKAKGLEQDVLVAHQLLGLQASEVENLRKVLGAAFSSFYHTTTYYIECKKRVTSVRYCSDLESSWGLSLCRQIYDTCNDQLCI